MTTMPWVIIVCAVAFFLGAGWMIDAYEANAKAGMITFGGVAYATVEIMPGRGK